MERVPDAETFKRSIEACPRIVLDVDAALLMTLLGALQLALRHEGFPPAAGEVVRNFIKSVKAELPDVLKTVTEMGDNPVFDR